MMSHRSGNYQPEQIRLVDTEAIRSLVYRYAHYFDAGDIERWLTLFTDDAQILTDTVGSPKGIEAIRDWAQQRQQYNRDVQIHHHMSNVVVSFQGEAIASVRSYLILTRQASMGDGVTESETISTDQPMTNVVVLASGVYQDIVVQTSHGWKFRRREVAASLPVSDI